MALVLLLPANALGAVQTESGQKRAAQKVCTTEKEAAKVMRAFLVKRQAEFSIPVRLKINNISGTGDHEKDLDKVMDRIFYLAFAETDKPYEGDYLYQPKGFVKDSKGSWKGDYFEGTLEMECPLFSTAAQEKAVDAAAAKIMKELALDGKSEYEKIRAIYDYICSHTSYEENYNSDVPFTAYSILVRGKGTCEGYAKAVYRLMREAGIGCRCIEASQENKSAAGHAWNIVRIGKLWYYVDATWDTSLYKANRPYQYFLKGSPDKSYVEHEEFIIENTKTDKDFWKTYPLSATDYVYRDSSPAAASAPEDRKDPDIFNYRSSPRNLKATAGKKRTAVLTWKKTPGASGYQIRYSLKKNMKSSRLVTIKKSSTMKKVIKNLQKKKYYFQIRAFRALPNYKIYGNWSRKAAVRIR